MLIAWQIPECIINIQIFAPSGFPNGEMSSMTDFLLSDNGERYLNTIP
jgi:hypothetical protein